MIQLTIDTNTAVAVNPHKVLFVKQAPTAGCVIVFANETRLHVKNNYLEVVGMIAGAINQ